VVKIYNIFFLVFRVFGLLEPILQLFYGLLFVSVYGQSSNCRPGVTTRKLVDELFGTQTAAAVWGNGKWSREKLTNTDALALIVATATPTFKNGRPNGRHSRAA